jgi:hypothetical protein
MARAMEITTPLGGDLLFRGMHGREEMSRLSEFQLELLSLRADIKIDDILGKNVTVKVAPPDESTWYFTGFASRFSAGGVSSGITKGELVQDEFTQYFRDQQGACDVMASADTPGSLERVLRARRARCTPAACSSSRPSVAPASPHSNLASNCTGATRMRVRTSNGCWAPLGSGRRLRARSCRSNQACRSLSRDSRMGAHLSVEVR